MAHQIPEWEVRDVQGKTEQIIGTVNNAPGGGTLVPSSPGPRIEQVLVRCKSDQNNARRLLVDVTGQANYLTLSPGEYLGWDLRSNMSGSPITQIRILGGSASNTAYEIVINYELS